MRKEQSLSDWYYKCTADPTDLTPLGEALIYFDQEYLQARKDVDVKGSIEQASARIPGITEVRFSQLQELEALLRYVDDEMKRVRFAAFKKYFEAYNRTLTSRDAQLYADADPKVLEMSELHNQVRMIRDKYIGILKALEQKSFSLNQIVKLRCAGLDDSDISW